MGEAAKASPDRRYKNQIERRKKNESQTIRYRNKIGGKTPRGKMDIKIYILGNRRGIHGFILR